MLKLWLTAYGYDNSSRLQSMNSRANHGTHGANKIQTLAQLLGYER